MGDKIAVEVTCQPLNNCDTDELSFRAYLARWLAVTAQLVPSLYDTILPYLRDSAQGAAGQCDGGTDGMTCGQEWNTTVWDGTYGVGQQMSALGMIDSLMIDVEDLKTPYTSSTGGTSKSDPSAGTGTGDSASGPAVDTSKISTADKAGAGILTTLVLILLLGGAWWMVTSSD